MVGKSSIVGSGYSLSESFYLKKYEVTDLFEDRDMLENYNRATLKDLRCDKPTFESDQPRTNNFSEDRLNLRHAGKRVTAEPFLPDGLNLDFDGLTKDKRGYRLDPNMQSYRKQQEERSKFIKFYADNDDSTPSSGINPGQMVKNIKSGFHEVKSRLKIFDDSVGSRQTGATQQVPLNQRSNMCEQQATAKNTEMLDEICNNRSYTISDFSNDTRIGWKSQNDAIVKVAKLGQLRGANPKRLDALKNRSNTYTADNFLTSWRDQNTTRALTLKMIDISKQKMNDMEAGKGLVFASSNAVGMRNRKITATDCTNASKNINMSNPETNSMAQNTRKLGAQTQIDRNKMDKVVIDPFIIDYMASINRKMTPREIKDLRESIKQSAAFTGILINQGNKRVKGMSEKNNELLWESTANFERGTSMKVANFKILVGKAGPKNQAAHAFEGYKTDGKVSGQRRGNLKTPELYNMKVVEYDQDAGMEAVGTKIVGGMGNKYMNHYINNDEQNYDTLDEITATCKSR